MTENKVSLLVLRETISELDPEVQDKINACADNLRAVLDETTKSGNEDDKGIGALAISLVGIEAAVALEHNE